MKKTSIRTRTLAPAVVLAVGALVATPAIATTTTGAEQTPADTGSPESATAEATAPSADEKPEAEPSSEAPQADAPDAAEETSQQEQQTTAPTETQEAEDPANISPSVEMDYPLQAQTVTDEGIEVRVKTAPNAEVDVSKVSVVFGAGYTLSPEGAWDGTADQNGDYTFTISPDTKITSSFAPDRNTTVGQLQDGDSVTVQIRSNGKNSSFTTSVEGTSEDPADISPSVEMDYPLQAQTVTDEGIEVRVKTAPNAEVDVSKVSVMFTGGYTLSPDGDWDGTADQNGDYTFTIAPDTKITSGFNPDRNTTVGQLQDGDGVVVQIRTNGKNTSFATEVEGEAEQPAEPTVSFPDHPDNAAERTIGEDFSATVAYTGATEGDEVRVVVNGNTQTHGEGNYEAPATVTETDGEFQVSLPAEFLDEVRSGTNADQDVLQVRVGTTRNHLRITEVETDPTEDPTDDPTEDPTENPTDDPTEDPTDDPIDEPTEGPSDDPSDNPSDGDDDEQSAPALTIEPDRISMSDFVDPERGVTLTVTGLEPGDDVEFGVDPTSGQNVDPATLPAVATDEGVASTVVYGVSSADATSYIGDFDVTVDGIDDAQAQAGSETAPQAAAAAADAVVGSFTVLSDEDADDERDGDRDDDADGDDGRDDDRDGEAGEDDGSGSGSDSDDSGSDDDSDRDGGTDLPRTGGEFGALAAGGTLLAIGAAAVIVTRRRMRQG